MFAQIAREATRVEAFSFASRERLREFIMKRYTNPLAIEYEKRLSMMSKMANNKTKEPDQKIEDDTNHTALQQETPYTAYVRLRLLEAQLWTPVQHELERFQTEVFEPFGEVLAIPPRLAPLVASLALTLNLKEDTESMESVLYRSNAIF